ncbi:MAG TPA: hypothetical protein VMT78_14985 [Terriglobia bacterium]|nr:hypothetical protein [Terriglobia bacterium]
MESLAKEPTEVKTRAEPIREHIKIKNPVLCFLKAKQGRAASKELALGT